MPLPNIFTEAVSNNVIQRINQLTPQSTPNWGKMNVAQMLAHCNVTYELVYENKHPAPNFFAKLLMKAFVKKLVTNEVPYKHNGPTGKDFLITDSRNFEPEKQRLTDYIRKTQQLGEAHFDQLPSHSFGVLNKNEWNNMFYKHLDHHLTQFGV